MTAHPRTFNRTQSPQLMVDTAGAYQYGVFCDYAGTGYAVRRNLATEATEVIDLSDVASNRLSLPIVDLTDDHYALTVGVHGSGASTVVHVAGNDHDHTTAHRYVRCIDVEDFTNPASWEAATPFAGYDAGGGAGNGAYTYNLWDRTSDDVLIWLCNISPTTVESHGRDWLAHKWVDDEWVPLASTGSGFFATTEITAPTGDAERVYLGAIHVEPDGAGDGLDRLHIYGIWRTDDTTAESQQAPFYLRSDDDGATWEAVDGTPVTIPITWATRAAAEINAGFYPQMQQGICIVSGQPFIVLDKAADLADTDEYVAFFYTGSAWAEYPFLSTESYPWALYDLNGSFYQRRRSGSSATRFRMVLRNVSTSGDYQIGGWLDRATPNPDPVMLRQGTLSFLLPEDDTPQFFEFTGRPTAIHPAA